jgi:hypothetical protein
MSFAIPARQVRDPNASIWNRLSSLRACVRSFCRLGGLPYAATVQTLRLDWTPSIPRQPPQDDFLRRTMDALERERNVLLDRRRGWEIRRARAKVRGGRQVSRAERHALAALRDHADAAIARIANA